MLKVSKIGIGIGKLRPAEAEIRQNVPPQENMREVHHTPGAGSLTQGTARGSLIRANHKNGSFIPGYSARRSPEPGWGKDEQHEQWPWLKALKACLTRVWSMLGASSRTTPNTRKAFHLKIYTNIKHISVHFMIFFIVSTVVVQLHANYARLCQWGRVRSAARAPPAAGAAPRAAHR